MKNLVLCYIFVITRVLADENSDEFINEINNRQNLWKAGRNFHKDIPILNLKGLLGVRSSGDDVSKNIPLIYHEIDDNDDLPESFDARSQWPSCKSIGEIADQSACGSCWAVAVASTISDRICIHSNGKLQPTISSKNIMSCAPSAGCDGGNIFSAWEYWNVHGVVTGGAYGTNIGCQPYPFAQCEHHINEGAKPKCPSEMYTTPDCVKTCDNTTLDFSRDLHYGHTFYVVFSVEKQIQTEIMKNGPVVTGFNVFSDLFHYKSGVYFKTAGSPVGSHAVRVLGWGVENGTKYWLVANSWNEDWGDKGLFKIRRGVDECAIETHMSAGLPKL